MRRGKYVRAGSCMVNADKTHLWKADVAKSVDFYNAWFMKFAPKAYRETRLRTTADVEAALTATSNLTNVAPAVLREWPTVLPMLRMATAPPIARDRLIGLAAVPAGLVKSMEIDQRIPPQMDVRALDTSLARMGKIITRLADRDVFPWLAEKRNPSSAEVHRAATIVADRLCGAYADPIIRNAQEARQLALIKQWLVGRGYKFIPPGQRVKFNTMPPATFAFRVNVPVKLTGGAKTINIPMDAVIMPKVASAGALPLFLEAKSAGDFTNTNKRRKEEAVKVSQLRANFGDDVRYVLFLCGYFDSGYLGYEAAEGIDWVWEHRIGDLTQFGV
jgi:hypothetical protein